MVSVALPAGARSQLQIDGHLVLEGSETRVIEGTDLHVTGEIQLADSASLTLRNSTVTFAEATQGLWGASANVKVQDDSALHVEASEFQVDAEAGTDPVVHFRLRQNARIVCQSTSLTREGTNSILFCWDASRAELENVTTNEVRLWQRATARIERSRVHWTVGLDFGDGVQAELLNLQPGTIDFLEVPATTADAAVGPRVEIVDSDIAGWSIGLEGDARLTLRGSTLSRLVLGLRDPEGAISGLRSGDYDDWDLQRDFQLQTVGNLVLAGTTVHSWILNVIGGSSPLSLSDSDLSGISTDAYSGQIAVNGCEIDAVNAVGGTPSLVFTDTSISRGLDLNRTGISLSGQLEFLDTAFPANWHQSSMRRWFTVTVQTPEGEPLTGASVSLIDAYGVQSERRTDSLGRCELLATFTDYDRDETFTVKAVGADGAEATHAFTFLTSSPVLIELPGP